MSLTLDGKRQKSDFDLPMTLEVGGKEFPINTDFRDVLLILSVFDDEELTPDEKGYLCLVLLYKTDNILELGDLNEAPTRLVGFLIGVNRIKTKKTARNFSIGTRIITALLPPLTNRLKPLRMCANFHICIGGHFSVIFPSAATNVIFRRSPKFVKS